MNFEEVKRYYYNGRLDSMRLSLGMRWDKVVDILFSHIQGMAELENHVDVLDDKILDLEQDKEDLEGTVEALQERIDRLECDLVEALTES